MNRLHHHHQQQQPWKSRPFGRPFNWLITIGLDRFLGNQNVKYDYTAELTEAGRNEIF